MHYLKGIETPVLITILRAQVDFYGKICQAGQASDCRTTIKKLQYEIKSRGGRIKLTDKPLFDFLPDLNDLLRNKPATWHYSN